MTFNRISYDIVIVRYLCEERIKTLIRERAKA